MRLAVFLWSAVALAAQTRPCLRYEPAVVELEGRLIRQTPPDGSGQPNPLWILRLARPLCVQGNPDDEPNSRTESNVRELQVASRDQDIWKRLPPLSGKRVRISGTLFHQHALYDKTAVLITVQAIR